MSTWQEYAQRPSSIKIYVAEISVADPDNPTADRETLYFSSDAISPELTDVYHEPCIKSLPTFARSLQAISLGGTSATYGTLTVLIGDGHLDSKIAGRLFAGAPVVIKSGFDGLPVANFKEIFTGHISASPKWTDTQLSIPLADGVGKFLDHKLTEQNLSGALPTVINTLLTSADIPADKRDSAMWDAWSAANTFSVWLPISANQTLASALDLLLAPLGCWYGFGRDGLFRIGTFGAPAADATPVAELTDIELTKFSGERNHGNHAWKVVVSYYSTTGDNPDTSEVSWEDSAIKELNPAAVEMSKTTALTSSTQANSIRDRWKDIFAARRLVADFTAKVQLFGVQLGDVVRVTRDRFDLNSLYIAQKVTDNMNGDSVSLELFR